VSSESLRSRKEGVEHVLRGGRVTAAPVVMRGREQKNDVFHSRTNIIECIHAGLTLGEAGGFMREGSPAGIQEGRPSTRPGGRDTVSNVFIGKKNWGSGGTKKFREEVGGKLDASCLEVGGGDVGARGKTRF